MAELHPKQDEILKLLKQNESNPLSIKELKERAKIDSPGVLYYHLNQLKEKGYLKNNPTNTKKYIVLETPDESLVYLNKYGLVQCGADGFMLDGNVLDRIPIQSKLLRFSTADAFIVEARGDSMEPKIKAGDIIIAKKQIAADPGDIVVCVYNEKAIVKKYMLFHDHAELQSLNKKHKTIEVYDNEELRIQGVVKNILKYDMDF
jgi:repressor LexA